MHRQCKHKYYSTHHNIHTQSLQYQDCLNQACVKCCTSPTCQPHLEARKELKRKESLLEGTDYISRTAASKRASKVTPGMFHDANMQYFGETVVIWNVHEFWRNDKWREDAIRRSVRLNDNANVADLSELSGRRKRKRTNGKGGRGEEDTIEGDGGKYKTSKSEETDVKKTKIPKSRRKTFNAKMDEWYRNSLTG